MQRLPWVTSWSSGELTRTILPSCSWIVRLQPTPQYGQTVSVCDCRDSSHLPAWRMSNSLLNISAPVGHPPMHLPQYTHADSGTRPSTPLATCAIKRQPLRAIPRLHPPLPLQR